MHMKKINLLLACLVLLCSCASKTVREGFSIYIMSEDSLEISFPANHTTLTDGYCGSEKTPMLVYDSVKNTQTGKNDYYILNPQQSVVHSMGDTYLSGIFTYTKQNRPHDLVTDYVEVLITSITRNAAIRVAIIKAPTIDETTYYDNAFHYPVTAEIRDSVWNEIQACAVDTCTIDVLHLGARCAILFPLSYKTRIE